MAYLVGGMICTVHIIYHVCQKLCQGTEMYGGCHGALIQENVHAHLDTHAHTHAHAHAHTHTHTQHSPKIVAYTMSSQSADTPQNLQKQPGPTKSADKSATVEGSFLSKSI